MQKRIPPETRNEEQVELPIIALNDMFYSDSSFTEAVNFARDTLPRSDIKSIIVPHHLLASNIITDLIKKSSGRRIDTIAIIGPNHENIGTNKIATVKARWQTPLGYVESDSELVDKFLSDFDLVSDLEVFEYEHSVGAMISFIKYYFPDTKVLPIVFDSYAGEKEAEKVNKWLSENLREDSLLITSIDFSHYLTEEEADKKDVETRGLIESRDIEKVLRLSNTENVDSPVSLATALMYADSNNLKTEIVHNTNSFNLLILKPTETTSYFGIIFVD